PSVPPQKTPPPPRTTPTPHPPRVALHECFPSRGHTRRRKGAIRRGQAEVTRRTGRRRFGCAGKRRRVGLGTLVWGCWLRCRGWTMGLQHATFDSAQPPHFAAHLDLRSTVQRQHGLGHITQKVVIAVAVRYAGELAGNCLDEGILLIGH